MPWRRVARMLAFMRGPSSSPTAPAGHVPRKPLYAPWPLCSRWTWVVMLSVLFPLPFTRYATPSKNIIVTGSWRPPIDVPFGTATLGVCRGFHWRPWSQPRLPFKAAMIGALFGPPAVLLPTPSKRCVPSRSTGCKMNFGWMFGEMAFFAIKSELSLERLWRLDSAGGQWSGQPRRWAPVLVRLLDLRLLRKVSG